MAQHMTREEARKEYYRICDAVDCGSPAWEVVSANLNVIRNTARRLDQLNLLECNGVIGRDGFAKWDEEDQQRNDANRERATNRARDAFAAMFDAATMELLEIEFQGDPRGPAITVNVKGGAQRVATFW